MTPRARELDRLIAEKFYGMEWIEERGGELHGWNYHPADTRYPEFTSHYFGVVPRYSEDPDAAGEVERTVEEAGCRDEYVRALEALGTDAGAATPQQRCRAALDVHPEYARKAEERAAESRRQAAAAPPVAKPPKVSPEGNVPESERQQARASKLVNEIVSRLVRLLQERPFRFVDTTREDARAYLARQSSLMGMLGREVNALQKLNTKFPRVFTAFLKQLGRERGELFAGSDFDPYRMREYKRQAEEMLRRAGVKSFLGPRSVVFMFHQGYTFSYFEGGDPSQFDSPVYQYVEGEKAPRRVAAGFAELLDAEVSLMEENNRMERESGGYFITVRGGFTRRVYPAMDEGARPLDTEDQFIETEDEFI